jgi:hypothetical protein
MTNEVQRFDITNSPGSGKFSLAFNGSEPTTDIAAHPPAGDVQRALEALSTIGTGNIVVTKDGNWGYVCGFANALGDRDLPLLVLVSNSLGSGGQVNISLVTQGAPEGGGAPPEGIGGGGGFMTLQTPCTMADLLDLVTQAVVFTGPIHHEVPVTSSGSEIAIGSGGTAG